MQETFISHLVELRTRLVRASVVVLAVFIVLFTLWPGAAVISEDWIIDARPGKVMLRILCEGVPVTPAWAPWLRRQQSRWAVSLAQLKQSVGPAKVQ